MPISAHIVRLRSSNGSKVAPTMYWSWKMPEAIGGSYYEENIRSCNTTEVGFGDIMFQEPGNMMGPTIEGIRTLIDRDPHAFWDDRAKKVVTTMHPSPRVFPIPPAPVSVNKRHFGSSMSRAISVSSNSRPINGLGERGIDAVGCSSGWTGVICSPSASAAFSCLATLRKSSR